MENNYEILKSIKHYKKSLLLNKLIMYTYGVIIGIGCGSMVSEGIDLTGILCCTFGGLGIYISHNSVKDCKNKISELEKKLE